MMKKKSGQFKEVPAGQLRWRCDPDTLGFKTTDDIITCPDIIGQRRAVNALRLGLDIDSHGYNLFVNGSPGTGRKTAIKSLLKETERSKRIPQDKIYVNNFKNPDMPILIRLNAGEGRRFKKDMEHFVDHLLKNIPGIFSSETYQERRQEKIDALKAMQTKIVKKFEAEAAKENFALVPMQAGAIMRPVLLPLIDGKAANFEQIRALQSEGKLSKEDVEKI
jgi:DNA polymerase III delta prime subunit